jgi:hypothetical protein
MARIYKRTDRITVRIDDITVKLAPLTVDQKTEIQTLMADGAKLRDLKKMTQAIALSIQYGMKGIEGVKDGDGNDYRLEFEGDSLKASCVDDLMNLEVRDKLTLVCSAMVNGVPKTFTDEQQKAIDGVEIVDPAPKKEDVKNV